MKIKNVLALIVSSLLLLIQANAIFGGALVYANETGLKTAVLKDLSISFDGKAPATIKCYNIDGRSFVRAHEIMDGLDMRLLPSYGIPGILITPELDAEGTESLSALREDRINANLSSAMVYYSGIGYEAECFVHNAEYFYKLSDISEASKNALKSNTYLVKSAADVPSLNAPSMTSFTSLDIVWDEQTSVIGVSRVNNDLLSIFNEARKANSVTPADATASQTKPTVEEHNGTVTAAQTVEPEVNTPTVPFEAVGQPELTKAPKVGTTLANILIDTDLGAYTNGDPEQGILKSNITEIYKTTSTDAIFGQCTWYGASRLREVTGVNIADPKLEDRLLWHSLDEWVDLAEKGQFAGLNGISDVSDIRAQSIAVWEGHVAFVEYVERDKDGDPITVYYSDANWGHNGTFKYGRDGIVRKADFTSFKTQSSKLYGYVIAQH